VQAYALQNTARACARALTHIPTHTHTHTHPRDWIVVKILKFVLVHFVDDLVFGFFCRSRLDCTLLWLRTAIRRGSCCSVEEEGGREEKEEAPVEEEKEA